MNKYKEELEELPTRNKARGEENDLKN